MGDALSDPGTRAAPQPHIVVEHLMMAYGDFVIQHDLNFTINKGEIFIIMGGSGCGNSTLLRALY
jgi:phospholipid/cholesterol/gamma-HCH transport system ATP-binding protein